VWHPITAGESSILSSVSQKAEDTMAFSDYKTLDQVQKEFTIIYQEENYLGTQPVALSQNFLTEMEFNRENIDVFASEEARAAAIIFPVLRKIYKQYYEHYSLWIQKSITYNEKLIGTPDYMTGTFRGAVYL
jgi:hypothetical protein